MGIEAKGLDKVEVTNTAVEKLSQGKFD